MVSIGLPGVSSITSCSRVKDSASPSGSAASAATIVSRVGVRPGCLWARRPGGFLG